MLGLALEAHTQQTYHALLQSHILGPLALTDTEPSDRPELAGLVPGFTGTENPFGLPSQMAISGRYAINPAFEWTGGLITTAADLARWSRQLHTNALLSATSLERMKTAVNRRTGQPDAHGYGLGMEIWPTAFGTAYGHSGFMPGFMSITAYLPNVDLAIAMQINADIFYERLTRGTSMFGLLNDVLPRAVALHD